MSDRISRRALFRHGGIAATVAAVVPAPGKSTPASAEPGRGQLSLSVNGTRQELDIDPRTTLLDLLRETLELTGTKKGCDHGQCGACTVHVGGRPTLACLTLAMSVSEPVVTIEGLGTPERLHPMQQAFIDHDAFQCGYCTPGQIMSAVALAKDVKRLEASDVREQMSGNLCRCSAYPNIVAAVVDGAKRMKRA